MMTARDVIEAASVTFGVSATVLRGHGRQQPTAWYRHATIWVTRHLTPLPWVAIARAFGRDATCIVNSCRQAETDPVVGELVEQLLEAIERDRSAQSIRGMVEA